MDIFPFHRHVSLNSRMAVTWLCEYSGGSKGGAPPTAQNFLDFMQFLGKFDKIICWRPPRGSAPHPTRNPGSAPGIALNVSIFGQVSSRPTGLIWWKLNTQVTWFIWRSLTYTDHTYWAMVHSDHYVTGTFPGTGIGWGSMEITMIDT